MIAGIPCLATEDVDKPTATSKPDPAKPQVEKAEVKDANVAAQTDDPKRFQPHGYIQHERNLTISGRAVNEEGEPVAGARVFVVPVVPNGVAYGNRQDVVEGKTGDDGCYRLKNVKVSVLEFAPQAVPRPTEALFQVFALADGYGYVWRHPHAFRPEKRPANSNVIGKREKGLKGKPDVTATSKSDEFRYVSFADEPIVVDLEFSPEVRLYGLITDDKGNPLENAVVQVGLVNSTRDRFGEPPRMWNAGYLEDSRRASDGQFNGFFALPEQFRLAHTDADGRYELRGIPRDCSLLTYLDYRPEYEPKNGDLKTANTPLKEGGSLVFSGELNHTFLAPVTINVTIVDLTGKPLSNVFIRGESGRTPQRAGSLDQTGATGVATLKLRPGKTVISIEPAIGQPFLPKQIELMLDNELGERQISFELEPAAEVVLEAIEKESGKPIPGVVFLSEAIDAPERKRVHSQLSFVDHPCTDNAGQLRAFFEPGERLFFVDQQRSTMEFEALEPGTQPIELSADRPTHVRFEFVRRPQTNDKVDEAEPIVDELKPLAELLKVQSQRFAEMRAMRFSLRHNNFLMATMTPEQATELLDSFNSKTPDECLESLRREFPEFNGLTKIDFITDGTKRRVENRYPGQEQIEVNVFNGEELLVSMGSGTQLDIYSRYNSWVHFLDMRDFWNGPAGLRALTVPKQSEGSETAKQSLRHVDGAWEIITASKQSRTRRIIDDSTGFERLSSFVYNQYIQPETRQYFPMRLANGVAVPKLSIRVHYQKPNQVRFEVTFVDNVELPESLARDTFILAVPSGTHVIDYRSVSRNELQNGRRGSSGIPSTDLPDVIAYCNRRSPQSEPVLKVGDAVPNLDKLTWLDVTGRKERVDLRDKILLIDFWGISCGPCVAQLAEVNDAAKHFANSKIAILGVHASGSQPDKVIEFVKKRELVFPIAIDQKDPAGRAFGLTSAAFGVTGIPTSVVVDTTGHVAYIGAFQQAIEIAHKLAQEN